MFYSHQLLARKAPLGQIWMAATMHAKMNRRKLDKLNIINICEEILNPSVPMALRLSGILMGGVVIVYERKVKLLYDDVTRLLIEINEAWKVKAVPDPTLLPKGKTHAKKEAITLPENEEVDVEEVEHSLHFSHTTTTMGFQSTSYFAMRLDSVDEPYINNSTREEDPSQHFHLADADNITLFECYESIQVKEDPDKHFERFDIEGDEETHPNCTFGENTHVPTRIVSSPPLHFYPRAEIIQDQHPDRLVNQQSEECIKVGQDIGALKRKSRRPAVSALDYEQTIIPGHIYQCWLQNASDIVSRRGRKRKRMNIISTLKIPNLMELPPVVLIGDLFTSDKKEIYYPPALLELWMKSTQLHLDSPSERSSTPLPLEPSLSPPPVHYQDFVESHFEDIQSGVASQSLGASREKLRTVNPEISVDEMRTNLMTNGLMVTPRNYGDNVDSLPSSASEHGFVLRNSEVDSGRSNRKRRSSSKNSSAGLETVAEEQWQHSDPNFKLTRLSENGLTPDQELLVETGPTQTQPIFTYHPVDKMTESIRVQMKAHFDTPGAPEVVSLDLLSSGMTRKAAALLFYQTCVLASRDDLRVEQRVSYGEILISKGAKM